VDFFPVPLSFLFRQFLYRPFFFLPFTVLIGNTFFFSLPPALHMVCATSPFWRCRIPCKGGWVLLPALLFFPTDLWDEISLQGLCCAPLFSRPKPDGNNEVGHRLGSFFSRCFLHLQCPFDTFAAGNARPIYFFFFFFLIEIYGRVVTFFFPSL